MSNCDKWRGVAANVIAHAWRDPAYKASVLQNPLIRPHCLSRLHINAALCFASGVPGPAGPCIAFGFYSSPRNDFNRPDRAGCRSLRSALASI
ncbi:hypothetical protein B0G84_8885 [Paraburkholderia sp. BL8N3]|nr:hypothetical protein B0G84_8885 [Paraburkholderia sp. BL8N3]